MISVVMPVFNSERFLGSAIESLQKQTFRELEIVILDDGSTDGTRSIAQSFAERDCRVRVFDGKRCGVGFQRNRGVEYARGEYVAMLDSDDIASSERLALQFEYLERHPRCGAVGSYVLRIDEDGSPIDEWRLPCRHDEIERYHLAGKGGAIVNPSVLMRKCAVLSVGGYNVQYRSAEDYELFLRLGEKWELANLPIVLTKYRLHAKSLTFSDVTTQWEMTRRALEEAWTRRGYEGLPPKPAMDTRSPSEEELRWAWARNAFSSGNFRTARKQAWRLLKGKPVSMKRWVLFIAALGGRTSHFVKQVLPRSRMHFPREFR